MAGLACQSIGSHLPKIRTLMAELADEERTFDLFFELSPDLFCIIRDGIIEIINSASMRLLGWSGDDLTGKSYLSLIHPDDAGDTQIMFSSDNNESFRFRNRCKTSGGGYISLDWNIVIRPGRLVYAVARPAQI